MTIGFARRAATYKRADLVFSQLDSLRAIAPAGRPAAVRLRRQGAPARRARQGPDQARLRRPRRPAATTSRSSTSKSTTWALGEAALLRRRPLAEQPAEAAGSLRHQRHEGGAQRRAVAQRPRRLVAGGLDRRRHRLEHRRQPGRRRATPRARRSSLYSKLQLRHPAAVLRLARRFTAASCAPPSRSTAPTSRPQRMMQQYVSNAYTSVAVQTTS